jgi:hypothetical protein
MVLVKANEQSEAGEMPSRQILEQMTAYNEELVKAGVCSPGRAFTPAREAHASPSREANAR